MTLTFAAGRAIGGVHSPIYAVGRQRSKYPSCPAHYRSSACVPELLNEVSAQVSWFAERLRHDGRSMCDRTVGKYGLAHPRPEKLSDSEGRQFKRY